jgi:A/G-specific adenine glycosylase
MSEFADRLINWQKVHGRHDLPWQNTADPYAIWVSEIMLQQTQVSAVIAYYSKFMQRFPNIATLANANQDDVLQYWSGLGYYSRARNLHQAAMTIMRDHHGTFPQNFETIQTLSGIGRSTAAAIASFAFNQTQTILDGNVKRVLARHFLIEGWTGTPKVERQLWTLAESLLPKANMVAYTQGLMDLGATICTRSKPKCYLCPLIDACAAYQDQRVAELPTPKPRKAIPEKTTTMLVLQHQQKIMLEKRPNAGIWGGLFSFPETSQSEDTVKSYIHQQWHLNAQLIQQLPLFQHVFTHFKLNILPLVFNVDLFNSKSIPTNYRWLTIDEALNAGIPAPIRQILQQLNTHSGH